MSERVHEQARYVFWDSSLAHREEDVQIAAGRLEMVVKYLHLG
jgi:hypothetical protein